MDARYPDLDGKVAVVTGAGRHKGLGEAIARTLAENGAKLVIHDLGTTKGDLAPEHGVGQASELEEVAGELRKIHPDIDSFAGDMRDEATSSGLVAKAVQRFGRLDIVINNAGVGYLFRELTETEQEKWDTVLEVNLRAPFFMMKHAVPQMRKQGLQGDWGAGRIISIASRAAKSGSSLTSSYVASKHGLVGLTRSAAVEFGPDQITVNAVCPNHVTTGLGAWQNEYMARMRGFDSVETYLDAMKSRIPLGRVGQPNDTAQACAFLCSGAARYITGEAMNVSGGEEYH